MSGQVFYSDNDSNTLSDVLKAGGLVEVFAAWCEELGHHEPHILIEDHTTHFQIYLPFRIDEASIQEVQKPFWAGRARPLITKGLDACSLLSDTLGQGFPYDEMQATAGAYYDRLKQLDSAKRTDFFRHPEAEEFAPLRKLAPHPDLRVYAYINQLRATTGYNRLLQQWYGEEIVAFRYSLACVLQSFSSCPNEVHSALQLWDTNIRKVRIPYQSHVTLLQLTNPASGKGAHATKANRLTIRNLEGNWLVEYLKLVGLFMLGLPLTVKSRSKNPASVGRKTYVLRPARISLSSLNTVMSALRTSLSSGTDVKLDVLCILHATRILAEQSDRAFQSATSLSSSSQVGVPIQVIAQATGFEMASYMNMGSAHALMESTTISLPSWLSRLTTLNEIRLVRDVIDDHTRLINKLQNERGEVGYEEHELFQKYCAWLLGGETDTFFDFAASYGMYVLSRMHRGLLAWPLTIAGVEKLMVLAHDKQSLAPILENDGFQEVARAIRRSTIIAHRGKLRDKAYPYDVHHSLGSEIRETAAYPADFLGRLSDFLDSYNEEIMRVESRMAEGAIPNLRWYHRRMLKTEYLHQIEHLSAVYGSELVCRMLVAYGHLVETAHSNAQGSQAETAVPSLQGQDA